MAYVKTGKPRGVPPGTPSANKGVHCMAEINLDQVKMLVEHGFLDREVAEFFGVSASTYARWKELNTKFRDLTMAWKEAADARVERSLWERATGYTHPEQKIFLGPGGVPVYADTLKHYPPDPVAMIFWLKNRHPDRWKDRQELQHSGTMAITKIEIELVEPQHMVEE